MTSSLRRSHHVAMLQALDKVLGTLGRQPDLVSRMGKPVPNTVMTGSSLEGAAAILGDALNKAKGTGAQP